MLPQKKKKITPEEYLEFEKNSELKNEYFDGEIFAMVGAGKNHNIISVNISGELRHKLKGTSCMNFVGDMRVKVEKIEKYTYPDIVVACEKIEFLEDELDSLVNPVVIIEILSNSTESYDRGLKFQHYQLIQSLQEYILVSQYHCQVEKYKRSEKNSWIYTSFNEINHALKIESIKCELPLSEIYHKVDLKTN